MMEYLDSKVVNYNDYNQTVWKTSKNVWVFRCKAGDCQNGVTPFHWIHDGVCFKCGGTGIEKKSYSSFEEIEKIAIRRFKTQIAYRAKKNAEWEAKADERAAEKAEYDAKVAQVQAEKESWKWLETSVGEVVAFSGVITYVSVFTNAYGGSTASVGVENVNGKNKFQFFSSAKFAFDLEKGEQVNLVGIVKEFSSYNDVKQTVMNRVKKG